MRLKLFSAAALAVALAGFGPRVAEAEIIWSGIQNITPSANSPQSFNGGAWEWGVEQGGPTHYAYMTPQDPGTSPNVPYVLTRSADHFKVDNLAFGTMIDGSTSGFWNSYPTNGSVQDNLQLWNFANSTGSFPVGTVGYAANRISVGGNFQYGWTEFLVNIGGSVTFIQQAFQSTPGVGIAVGAVPEIDPAGFGSALALALGALGMIERRRQQASV
ncbi:MAG: hypothetical protein RLZZ326_2167 [Planctomycetota bacterium]|jgi:hypothetical protein